jgi:bisanhydrobacterioruberin hydratase
MTVTLKHKVIPIYVLFIAGGIWHLLDWFQSWMRLLAAPLMIAVALVMIYEAMVSCKSARRRFLFWSFLTFCAGWGIEYAGIRFGWPFGEYQYSSILQPQLLGVPVAIGFAWVSIYLASCSLVWFIFEKRINFRLHWIVFSLLVSLTMVIFDAVMEPAAVHLNYWTWQALLVPLSNYIAWFCMGVMISLLWRLLALERCSCPLFVHVYAVQMLYFGLVLLDRVVS